MAIHARPSRERTAEPRIAQPQAAEQGEQHEPDRRPEKEVVEVRLELVVRGHPDGPMESVSEAQAVERSDPLGTVREVEAGVEKVVPVAEDLRQDLAEAERNDGQVVAPEAKRGKADQNADDRSRAAGDQEQEPGVQVDAAEMWVDVDCSDHDVAQRGAGRVLAGELHRRQPGGGVRAHGVEGDVAEVEQAGVADDDVQADGHHDVDQHHDAGVDVREGTEDRHREEAVPVEGIRDDDREDGPWDDQTPHVRNALPGRHEEHNEDPVGRKRTGIDPVERQEDDEREQADHGCDHRPLRRDREPEPALPAQSEPADERPEG